MPVYVLDGAKPEIAEGCFIAPDAVLIGKVRVRKGASIWFGAVLRADNELITVGEDSNVQDHSILHADPGQPVTIGRGVTIGHRVIVHSATIADHCLIGMGSILLNRACIATDSLVGAGALVTEDKVFEPGRLILGSPARSVRALTDEQKAGIRTSAATYVANGARYLRGLKP
jgi:carbonic anhydrase/acetyltransferase-like protein (isoleucine patch superfamily)